jgi:hypothetical protein
MKSFCHFKSEERAVGMRAGCEAGLMEKFNYKSCLPPFHTI